MLAEALRQEEAEAKRLIDQRNRLGRDTRRSLQSFIDSSLGIKTDGNRAGRGAASQTLLAQQLREEQQRFGGSDVTQRVIDRIKSNGGGDFLELQARLMANFKIITAAYQSFTYLTAFVRDLDREFRQFQAITAASAAEMTKLEEKLIGVSEKFKFTAVEVAQAATVMAQAGFSTREIEDSMEAVALLATATGTDLKTTVDTITSVLGVFDLQASETRQVANVLTGAINETKLTMDTQVVLLEDDAPIRSYKLEHAALAAAGGGVPPRNLTVEVFRRDQFLNLSDPVSLAVTNEAPAAPASIEARPGSFSIFASVPKPAIRDFGGIVVHVSNTQGFTPSAQNKVYEGPQTSITFPQAGGTWFVKVAVYDLYSNQDLNYIESASVVVSSVGGSGDTTPPAAPADLAVTPGPSLLFLDWTNPPDSDFYFTEIWRGPNSDVANAQFVGTSPTASYVDNNLAPGTTYWMFLRAVDTSGNKSAFTAGVSAIPTRITTTQIADDAITSPLLAAGAVVSSKIAAGAVTADKISVTDLAAINVTVKNADIENLTIGGEKIQANAISNSVSAVATSSVTAGNGTEILSAALPTTGSNPVYVLVTASIIGPYAEVGENSTKVPYQQKLTLRRNGVDLESAYYTGTTEGTEEIHTIVFIDQAPVQGSATTYSVVAFGNGQSSGCYSVVVKRRSMLAMELKK